MAFGNQIVNQNKGADNSHLRRCREVEEWAMDSYRWCCEQFGKENVIGFQVHLDEKSPHCHALVIPVGRKGKEKKERVMWSAKFGKNGGEYKAILHAMHTSLYETVGRKYGLERGDCVKDRNIRHLDKHEFYREQQKLEKAIKGLTTMKENLESSIARLQDEIQTVRCRLSDRKITLHEADSKVHKLENEISALQEKLLDKAEKLQEKQQELNRLMKDTPVRDKKQSKNLVIRDIFCIFVGENQTITNNTKRLSHDYRGQSYRKIGTDYSKEKVELKNITKTG